MDDLQFAIRKRIKAIAKRYLRDYPPANNLKEAEECLVSLLLNMDQYARKDQVRQETGRPLNQ